MSTANNMHTLTKVVLFTDDKGFADFREEPLQLGEASPGVLLSEPLSASGLRLRWSPVGFRSGFHCTVAEQWVFVMSGAMEIGLQDGSSRTFQAGDHFFAADLLPLGASFDASVHGHSSRQVGTEPLITVFVRE